jgi:vitamin B12 transport system substrate-binding protein
MDCLLGKSLSKVWISATPTLVRYLTLLCLLSLLCLSITRLLSHGARAQEISQPAVNTAPVTTKNIKPMRIISLSPHLTELTYAIGRGEQLIAVSDYSDYPKQANSLPSVASYQGANIAEIMRLQPTHILVWRGGNKDADIQKLKTLGFNLFESHILKLDDLIDEIRQIGQFLDVQKNANELAVNINNKLSRLKIKYASKSRSVVYYLSTQPLLGLGSDPWLNDLLASCGLNNLYKHNLAAYPQLQIANIVRENPDIVIAAGKYSNEQVSAFWSAHLAVFNPTLLIANPDALHRFTPRSLDELNVICEGAYK